MPTATHTPTPTPMPMTTLPAVLLVGAGRMGGALFSGWCRQGLAPSVLVDPRPPSGLARSQDNVAASLDTLPDNFRPEAAILAVKPQMAADILPHLARAMAGQGVVLSILAGKKIAGLQDALGVPVVRAMPNTPAAIGHGITAACAGPGVTASQRALCDALLASVGDVVWVDDEALIDPITAISGSGPAYVFLLAELMEQAGIESGVPPHMARQLARKTIAGAGALLDQSPEDAADLRRAVTSPKGATEKALEVLMARDAWPRAVRQAMAAVVERSRELGA
jgi:pyrroline-5-carboxylate reductase